MDSVDRTNQDMEMYEKTRRTPYRKEAEPTGYCLFCGEEVSGNKRWCCPSCRDMWEKEQRRDRKRSYY